MNAPAHSNSSAPSLNGAPLPPTLTRPVDVELSPVPREVLRAARRPFYPHPVVDAELQESVREFLSAPNTHDAVLREFALPNPNIVQRLTLRPSGVIGCGHSRIGVTLEVAALLAHQERMRKTFVIKIEQRVGRRGDSPYLPANVITADDIELRVNELLRESPHRAHYVRTLTSQISPSGHRLALETCAHGVRLSNVLQDNYPVGLAAATRAMEIMCDTWHRHKISEGHGILFDSHLDDIVVAGTTPKSAFPCFVDCHEGRYFGGAPLLLRGVAHLMVDTLYHTPIRLEGELLCAFSTELIRERVLEPLRALSEPASPEDLFAVAYGGALEHDSREELGNPWKGLFNP